jgi:hypothetical protein
MSYRTVVRGPGSILRLARGRMPELRKLQNEGQNGISLVMEAAKW